jgi:hypothetical protein
MSLLKFLANTLSRAVLADLLPDEWVKIQGETRPRARKR